ncbi:MAG: TonB-dependent receptor [Bacteroidales bacterium]
MKSLLYFILGTIMLLPVSLFANQSARVNTQLVNGRVVDKESNEPMPYVNIFVENSSVGTTTDEDGSFVLEINLSDPAVVSVKSLGYKTLRQTLSTESAKSPIVLKLEEDILSVDEVVVSANRNEISRKMAPTVVNVISAKQFEAVGACDLSQSLSYKSGVRVENNCQNCGFPQVRINGLEGPYTQILIDSRPIVSALSGVYGLEQMPVNMIERVEVLRGGGSALFGANAIAGVVNIITKDPVKNYVSLSTELRSTDNGAMQETVNANASLVGKDNRSGITLFQSYRNREQYDRDGDGYSEMSKLNGHTLGLQAFYRPTLTSKLSLQYHSTHEFRRGGNAFDLRPHEADIAEQTDHTINSGGLNYDIFINSYKHKLSVYGSMQSIKRDSYYGAGQDLNAYGRSSDLTWMAGVQGVNNLDRLLFSPATMTYGLEFSSNSLHDIMLSYDRDLKQDVRIGSAFYQNEWSGRYLKLLVGGRLDKHNLIDHLIFSPRVNLLYSPTEWMRYRASYSTGFRAPQAYDEDLHVAAVGGEAAVIQLADNLKEERSTSYSASADFDFKMGDVDVTFLAEGFYTDLSNVFYLESLGSSGDGTLIFERRNGKGARVAGVNFDLGMAYRRWIQLQLSYTWQKSQYKEALKWSDDPEVEAIKNMVRTPNSYGSFTLTSTPIKQTSIALSGVYTGRMYVPHFAGYIDQDRMEYTKSFFDMNLKVSYEFKLKGGLSAQLSTGVQNIFDSFQKDLDKGEDRDSKYFYGPTAPRSYVVGLKLTL